MGIMFSSCLKVAKKSIVPTISFKSITLNKNKTATLVISFSDGGGNLFSPSNDTTRRLWANYYYKDTLPPYNYRAICFGTGTDSIKTGYIINKDGLLFDNAPVSGEFSINITDYKPFSNIKSIKYVIYLIDKNNQKSNVIVTPAITVP